MALTTRARILLLAVVILSALAALVWWLSARSLSPTPVTPLAPPTTSDAPVNTNAGTNTNAPGNANTPSDANAPGASPAPTANGNSGAPQSASTPAPPPPPAQPEPAHASAPQSPPPSAVGLLLPVAGVRPDQLRDTFADARSEGRVHDAIDIMAPCGTPVYAAADGPLVKFFQSARGGTTIYQRVATDDKLILYYAHLQRYADGLAENQTVRRGQTIAYVGDTGNAGPGNCHLHFALWLVTDPKRYWDGQNINPYPLLRSQ